MTDVAAAALTRLREEHDQSAAYADHTGCAWCADVALVAQALAERDDTSALWPGEIGCKDTQPGSRLVQEIDDLNRVVTTLKARLADARREAIEARAWLAQYGVHPDACAITEHARHAPYNRKKPVPACDCGLAALLAPAEPDP